MGTICSAYIALLLLAILVAQTQRRQEFVSEVFRQNRLDYAVVSRYVQHLPITDPGDVPNLSATKHPGSALPGNTIEAENKVSRLRKWI